MVTRQTFPNGNIRASNIFASGHIATMVEEERKGSLTDMLRIPRVSSRRGEDEVSEGEMGEEEDILSPSIFAKQGKSRDVHFLKTMRKNEDGQEFEGECESDTLRRIQPCLFKKAKYIMKPLEMFLDTKAKANLNNIVNSKIMRDKYGGQDDRPLNKGISLQLGFGRAKKEGSGVGGGGISSSSSSSMLISPRVSQYQQNRNQANQTNNSGFGEVAGDVLSSQEMAKMKNIFNENDDLKQKNVSLLFNSGPRYDKNRQLLKYSIVGKAEWYKKVEQQKQGNKIMTKKTNILATNSRKQSVMSSSQNISCAASSSSRQGLEIKQPISRQFSRKSNARIIDETEGNGAVQTVSKEYLLMKYKEIEQRLIHNKEIESKEQEIKPFQEKIDLSKQERYLERYYQQCNEWSNMAASLVQRQEKQQTLIGRGQVAQQAYSKYKGYFRHNVEETLLARSEEIQRCRNEENEFLEHLKEPCQTIGMKNLWESMLRNKEIDITTKHSQQHKLLSYFFPKLKDSRLPKQGEHFSKEKDDLSLVDVNSTLTSRSAHPEDYVLSQYVSPGSQLHSNHKTDLKFKHLDTSVRSLSTTNGARITTQPNRELLEVIRTPRLILDSMNASSINRTPQKDNNNVKTGPNKIQVNLSLNQDSPRRLAKYAPLTKNSYLEYFTSSVLDSVAVNICCNINLNDNSNLCRFKERVSYVRRQLQQKKMENNNSKHIGSFILMNLNVTTLNLNASLRNILLFKEKEKEASFQEKSKNTQLIQKNEKILESNNNIIKQSNISRIQQTTSPRNINV